MSSKIIKGLPDGFIETPFDKKEDWRNAVCLYCGAPSNSSNHIPPKSLYLDEIPPKQMRTVPCCKSCNARYSQSDDDWFRNIIVDWCAQSSEIAKSLLDSKVARSGKRKPNLLKQKIIRTELVDEFTQSGIYIGKKEERFPFTLPEQACLIRMVERLSKGYYWVLSKKHPPKHYKITLAIPKDIPADYLQALKLSQWITSGNEQVFMCKALPIAKDFSFILYMFTFYRKFTLLVAYHKPDSMHFDVSASGLLLTPQ
ncbi:MAG: hypothetical protein QF442_02920 [Candidatus Peribacteraceae bacterium]|nr:hypothetical protein [Candidatus Peribacteraceae bacterium]